MWLQHFWKIYGPLLFSTVQYIKSHTAFNTIRSVITFVLKRQPKWTYVMGVKCVRDRDSVLSVVIRLRTERSGVHNRTGECFTFSTKISRDRFWMPSSLPFKWELGAPSSRVKWPGCESDHPPPPIAAVRNEWGYTSTPTRLHGVYGDVFTFAFSLCKYWMWNIMFANNIL